MADISSTFRSRWAGGRHVGAAKPVCRVFLRPGRFNRRYADWPGNFSASIPGETQSAAWQSTWEASTSGGPYPPWTEIPNIRQCTLEQGFDENGINRLALEIDNVRLVPVAGPGGTYRVIDRGFASPLKGYTPPDRKSEHERNSWYQVLTRNSQISVWQGYGTDTMVETFKGLVDDVDLSAAPDVLTVTARDYGQQLIDSKMFGWNISKQLRDPVVFCDRLFADDVKAVGAAGPKDASSYLDGYPPRYVTDTNLRTFWQSDAATHAAWTEWLQIRLPAGRYKTFHLTAGRSGMEMFVGIFARGDKCTRDGVHIDEGFVFAGQGIVDGANGGWPYVKKIGATVANARKAYELDASYVLGADSVLRVGFRNLQSDGHGHYRAVVKRLAAFKRKRREEATRHKWILCDDVSDVVRVVLRWAGFKDWIVEDTGTTMTDKLIFNRQEFYIDVIRRVAEITGFVFFMGDPYEPRTLDAFLADNITAGSIGIPHFRASTALRERNAPQFSTGQTKPMQTIRDTQALTGISVRFTDETLGYIIRVRGAIETTDGQGLGSDTTKRCMFVYRPPWWDRLSGLIKHVVHYELTLKTDDECEVACYLIALNMALQSATATFEVASNPELALDDQVYLVDAATGIAQRLWIAQRSSTFTAGANASWKMSLGGSLIDTPDIVDVTAELNAARAEGLEIAPVNTGQNPVGQNPKLRLGAASVGATPGPNRGPG